VGSNAPTAINEVSDKDNQNSIQVFPTEFSSEINVTANVINNMPVTISLTDVTGKVMLTSNRNLFAGYNNVQILCPQNLPQQLYLVKIQNSTTREVLSLNKVVKH
jgi:hypothetical protein